MTERRVTEVVRQHDRLDQVLVRAQRARHGARHLRNLERVRESIPEVIAFRVGKHLGLVLQPPEGARVHDPVAVALERGPVRVRGLRLDAAA